MDHTASYHVPEKGAVLGIDVGWSEVDHTTGACVLSWDSDSIDFTVCLVPADVENRRKYLRDICRNSQFDSVAIDGPLRVGMDKIGEYRLAELLLTRRFGNCGYGKPGQSHSGNGLLLNQHATEIAKAVLEANCVKQSKHRARIDAYAVVESFPTTFLAVLLDADRRPSIRAKSDAFFESLLGPDSPSRLMPDTNRIADLITSLLPNRQITSTFTEVKNHEHRAALICAITALCVACRRYVAVGDARNGYIILPPRASSGSVGLQTWAFKKIQLNAKEATDWKDDRLSFDPPKPHVIVEAPDTIEELSTRY